MGVENCTSCRRHVAPEFEGLCPYEHSQAEIARGVRSHLWTDGSPIWHRDTSTAAAVNPADNYYELPVSEREAIAQLDRRSFRPVVWRE